MIEAKIRKAYVDQSKMIRWLDKKSQRGLLRAGAFIRRTAMQSMRSSKKSAPPGTPPRAHKNPLLKRGIRFGYDTREKRMVVGPLLVQKNANKGIPRLLEKGGFTTRLQGNFIDRLTYQGNPYMEPAFEANVGKIAEQLKM